MKKQFKYKTKDYSHLEGLTLAVEIDSKPKTLRLALIDYEIGVTAVNDTNPDVLLGCLKKAPEKDSFDPLYRTIFMMIVRTFAGKMPWDIFVSRSQRVINRFGMVARGIDDVETGVPAESCAFR